MHVASEYFAAPEREDAVFLFSGDAHGRAIAPVENRKRCEDVPIIVFERKEATT